MLQKQVHLNIPVSHFQNVLSWDEQAIKALVEKATGLAVRVGLRLDEDKEGIYLKEAERKGAKIDRQNRAVMFTQEQVERTIAVMQKTTPVPDPMRPLSICERGREHRFLIGNGANLLFDWKSWAVKRGSTADLIDLCQWAQGYDDLETLIQPVIPQDIDPRLVPIYSYAIMGKYCRKEVWHNQPTAPIHVHYLNRMARVVEKHRGFFQPMPEFEYISPPFRLSKRSIDTMFARVDSGICEVMGLGAMSVAGMSAPLTVPCLAVTALAEILAGLTFFNIVRPGHGLRTVVCSGSLDLRTARVNYYATRTHLCNLATWELVVRGLGVDATCLTWYRQANEPGLQAAYEFGTATAFFSSTLNKCNPEIGGLSCGNVFSPHQAVMDVEIAKEFNELTSGFEVELSDVASALDDVVRARFEQATHMASSHTRKHMMEGVPFSAYFFKGLSAGAQHDKDYIQTEELMEKTVESVKDSIAKGKEVEPDEELGNELYEFVKEAAAELGTEAPPKV